LAHEDDAMFTRRVVLGWALLTAVSASGGSADVLVVCPQPLKSGLKEWLAYRREQGHTIAMIKSDGDMADIRRRIRSAVEPGKTKFLVIVGDSVADGPTKGTRRIVPTALVPAKVNIHWGPERDIATDNTYADLDGDQLPDLAVGRVTADSAEDLRTILAKVMDYERSTHFGDWRRRISIVGCPGDFGAVIDQMIESSSRKLTTEGIPAGFVTTATYGSWRSPYCPDPRRFLEVTVDRLNEGSLFWVYIGHGQCRHVDHVTTPGDRKYPIFSVENVDQLTCDAGNPIAVFLACYTGRFDDVDDCLGEEMLRRPGGPVAVYAATRVTMPYAMTVMGGEMMKGYFVHRLATVGELVQHAKRQMILGERTSPQAKSMDTLALTLNPKSPDLAAERMEHVLMFHLLGDPLMRLRHPTSIDLEPPTWTGREIRVRGRCSLAGRGTIELVPPRDKLAFTPPPRRKYEESALTLDEFESTYAKANAPVLASSNVVVTGSTFEGTLVVPDSFKGSGFLRVYVEGEDGFAVGDVPVTGHAGGEESAGGM
jgi:hypothetical protein